MADLAPLRRELLQVNYAKAADLAKLFQSVNGFEGTTDERGSVAVDDRTNNIIASVWGSAFTLNALLAWLKMKQLFFSELTFELISYALLIGVAVFTQWYPAYLRRQRAASSAAA